MNILEAIETRCSRRSYLGTPIADDKLTKLQLLIENYNHISGLSIQLIEDGGVAFQGLSKSYGMFHEVKSFFAIVGREDEISREKAGYYGELLVLEATKLGLGTCWVGGSFDRKHCPCLLKDGEVLFCVITVGNVEEEKSFREKAIYMLTHRKRKPLEHFYTADVANVPDWFMEGVKSMMKAPSAVNLQPVHASYEKGSATLFVNNPNPTQWIDLGIAKAHFELASGKKIGLGNHSGIQ